MFEFIFDDAELEALNNLVWVDFEYASAQSLDWIFLGHYVWKMDLDADSYSDTSEHPNKDDKVI
jgi:hypothetical protein